MERYNPFLTEELIARAQGDVLPPLVADDSWRWCATCSWGADEAVIYVAQVTGERENMRMIGHSIDVIPALNHNLPYFVQSIEFLSKEYPGITIGVNGDGIGGHIIKMLGEAGVKRVQSIRWGQRPAGKADMERFINKRAYANYMAANAIKGDNVRLLGDPSIEYEGSKIMWTLDVDGRYVCLNKKKTAQLFGGLHTERWDVHCFPWLMDFTTDEKE